jgi:hypothetical protein
MVRVFQNLNEYLISHDTVCRVEGSRPAALCGFSKASFWWFDKTGFARKSA